MEIELQGPQECLLASLSALSGVSLNIVRNRALTITGTLTWDKVVLDSFIYSSVATLAIEILCKELNLPKEAFPFTISSSREEINVDLSKRGTITIRTYSCSPFRWCGHIMPYERGKIYDPQEEDEIKRKNGQTLEEIKKQYNKAIVAAVFEIGE